MTALTELAFPAMGTSVRLLAAPGAPLEDARALIEDLEARLTRFDSASELSVLNADPRETVPASRTLRDAVRSAIAGAAATDGLVDPTLLGAVVRAGYDRSLVGHPRANLREVLAAAPEPRPASPPPAVVWRRIHIDDDAGTITRPPGVKLDLGGSAKGLAADFAAELLAPYGACAADLGGDLRVHGVHEVLVPNPVLRMPAEVIELRDDAVATSGIDKRLWWDAGGRPAHHLLDPATGRPAWTGVLCATAKAPTAALAEALAKAAVLAGPAAGRRVLSRFGGLLITWDGAVIAESAGADWEDPQTRIPPRCEGGMRDPMEYAWWLASRASGIVALVLIALSVAIGLAMAAKAVRKPGVPRILIAVHEHAALAALVAIAVHGITLLGDHWLDPGILGITVPFVIDHEPAFTGLGIIGGYLAAILGLTFYLRRRIGNRRWRNAHRLTPLVYVLGVIHTVGSGSDAGTAWLTAILIATGTPILYLGILRALPAQPVSARAAGAESG